jgi:hypothetical protein
LIEVRVNGCSKNRQLGRIIRDSTQFFIKKLMPRKRRLKVIVQIVNNLLENEGIHGDCLADDFEVNHRHYEFIIRLNHDLNDIQLMISTLAHEVSHVKQYAIGQLRYDYSSSNVSIWEGKKYNSDEIDYDDLPWEIDALKSERALMSIYK